MLLCLSQMRRHVIKGVFKDQPFYLECKNIFNEITLFLDSAVFGFRPTGAIFKS